MPVSHLTLDFLTLLQSHPPRNADYSMRKDGNSTKSLGEWGYICKEQKTRLMERENHKLMSQALQSGTAFRADVTGVPPCDCLVSPLRIESARLESGWAEWV